MLYVGDELNKEHDPTHVRGSCCPPDITIETAQLMLESSVLSPDRPLTRYAVNNERAFEALEHGNDCWHGYPVAWHEVPPDIRRRWLQRGYVTESAIQAGW